MKTWTFYWLDGKREVLTGETPAGALNHAVYAEGDQDHGYAWDSAGRTWKKTKD